MALASGALSPVQWLVGANAMAPRSKKGTEGQLAESSKGRKRGSSAKHVLGQVEKQYGPAGKRRKVSTASPLVLSVGASVARRDAECDSLEKVISIGGTDSLSSTNTSGGALGQNGNSKNVSESARSVKVTENTGTDTEAIERCAMEMLDNRAATSSICPSEVARALGGQEWRNIMEAVREVGRGLARAGQIRITQVVWAPTSISCPSTGTAVKGSHRLVSLMGLPHFGWMQPFTGETCHPQKLRDRAVYKSRPSDWPAFVPWSILSGVRRVAFGRNCCVRDGQMTGVAHLSRTLSI